VTAEEENRVAIVENGVLDISRSRPSAAENLKGNIFKGGRRRGQPALEAAFVDYGGSAPASCRSRA